ncbi:MAG: monovalent cation/H(+) antiporter subunit G [Ruminococcaceae bacterium]|nr:monovalent cation/H(+) antiporter subunit G [Oscillospiraceae bacterium]
MLGWIQFIITAVLIAIGIIALFVSILGTYRFRFALNRIHSAAISDTFCMFFILAGLAVASGFNFATLKILLILAFMWCTSPISAHMLASLEYHTDEHLEQHCEFRRLKSKEDN